MIEEHKNRPQGNRAFVLFIILLGSIVAIGPLAIDMYLPSFVAIAESFNVSDSRVELSLSSYFIGLASSQILYGPIVDRFGKRAPLFFGLFVFITASILCCFAKDVNQLIILRFFQALGGCSCMVIPRAIVRDIFSPQECAKVFSHLMLVMGIAPIVAPFFGSFLLGYFGWKAIFVFLAFFGTICLFCAYQFIPETRESNPDDKISQAFKKYAGILKDRNFVVCALSGGLSMAGLFAYITGSPFIFLKIFNLSARDFSLLFAINSCGFIAASQINARLLKKFSMNQILGKILLVPAILGIVMIFVSSSTEPSFFTISILIFFILSSSGIIVPNSTALAMANQGAHSGSASALLGTIHFVIATLTSLLVSNFHNGTVMPVALVLGSCSILSFVIYRFFRYIPTTRESS